MASLGSNARYSAVLVACTNRSPASSAGGRVCMVGSRAQHLPLHARRVARRVERGGVPGRGPSSACTERRGVKIHYFSWKTMKIMDLKVFMILQVFFGNLVCISPTPLSYAHRVERGGVPARGPSLACTELRGVSPAFSSRSIMWSSVPYIGWPLSGVWAIVSPHFSPHLFKRDCFS